MKLLIALFVIGGFLAATAFVQAAPRSGKGGGPAGTVGTISTVGAKGFAMNTDAGKEVDVLCDNNTKFKSGTEDAAASDIKEGVRVAVQGGTSGNQIMATLVTILPAKHKKK